MIPRFNTIGDPRNSKYKPNQMNKWATVSFLIVLIAAPVHSRAQATNARSGFGSVEGHVICDDGGTPARLATVRLVPLGTLLDEERGKGPVPSAPQEMWTDLDGYYVFPSVQPGRYIIDVMDDGYSRDLALVRDVLDDFTPKEQKELLSGFPQVIVMNGGAARADVVVHRGGAISGRVSFDTGGVLSGVEVTAYMVSSSLFANQDDGNGGSPKGLDFSVDGKTDDRGVYRISGLPEGKYRIRIRLTEPLFKQLAWMDRPVRTGRAELLLFAPEALSEGDARLLGINQGDEATDVDITVPTRMLHSVGGIVTQNGVPVEHTRMTIRPQGQKNASPLNWAAETISDGSYRFDLMPSGTYVIKAEYYPAKAIRTPTSREITVVLGDDNVLDANVELGAPIPTK